MTEEKKHPKPDTSSVPEIFKDALRALGMGPVVDRKKNVDKAVKDSGG